MNDLLYSLSNERYFDNTNMNERSKKMNINNQKAYNMKKSINPKLLNKEFLIYYEKYFTKYEKLDIETFLNFEILKFVGIILVYFGIILFMFTGVPNLLLFLLF
tara:strand:+ start:765 stop:1076 length:312 start_codon:yes stop_codon:yes gene_type:complete